MSESKDAASDIEYTRLLVGQWQADEPGEPMDWHHVTIFHEDGKWIGFGAGEKKGVFKPFFSSGTWFVKDSCVHTKVEASPTLPMIKGRELSYVTLSVDAKEWVWKTLTGQVVTSRRLDEPRK